MSNPQSRMLICEGTCNPDLKIFDEACERWAMFGDNYSFVVELRKQLKHTLHESVGGGMYEVGHGWVKMFKCTECGKAKRVTGL